MKVIISDAAIRAVIDTPDVLKLHDLIVFAKESKRYSLFFESADGLNLVLSTFMPKIAAIYRVLLEASFRDAPGYPTARTTVKIAPVEMPLWNKPIPILPLDEAIKLLKEKLAILVENAANDWNFLLGIMPEWERKLLQDYVRNDWAEPVHGGGDTLGKLLAARLAEPRKAFRTFVLFDSDRLHPDEFDPDWTTARPGKQAAACNAYEWERQILESDVKPHYWMLKRRFIESYMPREELQKGAENKTHPDACNAFFRMDCTARWYYNMKEGLLKDQDRDDKERCRDLYRNLTPDMRNALAGGFGKTLARHYAASLDDDFAWDFDARNEADQMLPRLFNLL